MEFVLLFSSCNIALIVWKTLKNPISERWKSSFFIAIIAITSIEHCKLFRYSKCNKIVWMAATSCELLTVYIRTKGKIFLKFNCLSFSQLLIWFYMHGCDQIDFNALQYCKDNIIKWAIDWNTDKGSPVLIASWHLNIDQWFKHRMNGFFH